MSSNQNYKSFPSQSAKNSFFNKFCGKHSLHFKILKKLINLTDGKLYLYQQGLMYASTDHVSSFQEQSKFSQRKSNIKYGLTRWATRKALKYILQQAIRALLYIRLRKPKIKKLYLHACGKDNN